MCDHRADYTQRKCIHYLFEAQADQTLDAVAVVFEEEHLSYAELNRQANQLTQCLRHLGVGAEILVGICMERSLEMPVAVLGILKAGGAYAPVDYVPVELSPYGTSCPKPMTYVIKPIFSPKIMLIRVTSNKNSSARPQSQSTQHQRSGIRVFARPEWPFKRKRGGS